MKDRQKRNLDEELAAGKAPGFTIPLTMKKAKLGESVTFDCLPYGKPFPTIEWLKDGIKVTPSENIKIEADADGTQRLIVSNIDALSEGKDLSEFTLFKQIYRLLSLRCNKRIRYSFDKG